MASPAEAVTSHLAQGGCYVALTHEPLNIPAIMDRVRSPKAGANVLFAGTTRDSFDGQPVQELHYTAYAPRALQTMLHICTHICAKHALTAIAMIHRLGTVPIGDESILVAVSSPHRQAAWRAGEEALEECKRRAEVWKREEFGGDVGGVWRANRDGAPGVRIDAVEAVAGRDPDQDIPGEDSGGDPAPALGRE